MTVQEEIVAILHREGLGGNGEKVVRMTTELAKLLAPKKPINIVLFCPICSNRHVDRGDFKTKEHHSHTCQKCGFTFRPCVEPSFGVEYLPGFKSDETDDASVPDVLRRIEGLVQPQPYNPEHIRSIRGIIRHHLSGGAEVGEGCYPVCESNNRNYNPHSGPVVVRVDYFKPSGKWYTEDNNALWHPDPSHYTKWQPFSELHRIKDMYAVCMHSPLGFPQLSRPTKNSLEGEEP